MEKCITEKKKSSNILHTSTRGELINDLSLVELVLEKQNNNKNSRDVEITKGKGKNIEKWIKKNKESNITLSTFTGEEHRNDDHSLVQSVVEQSINDNTGDKKIKKGNKCKKKKCIKSITTSTSDLVDVQVRHYAGEDATPHEEKCACNDMKQHSLASDISLQRSNMSEVLQDENHVKETNDEHKIGDHLPLELLLEKQSNNNITQNEENEKGEGKFIAGEDTTMCEANSSCDDLNPPSSNFDVGTKATEGIKYGSILDAAVAFLGIRSRRKL
ncbi:hypothetical protein LXL04_022440 [Taraxacum kok-saghyz]